MTKHSYKIMFLGYEDRKLFIGSCDIAGEYIRSLGINSLTKNNLSVLKEEIEKKNGYTDVSILGVTQLPLKVKP